MVVALTTLGGYFELSEDLILTVGDLANGEGGVPIDLLHLAGVGYDDLARVYLGEPIGRSEVGGAEVIGQKEGDLPLATVGTQDRQLIADPSRHIGGTGRDLLDRLLLVQPVARREVRECDIPGIDDGDDLEGECEDRSRHEILGRDGPLR
jgi:hypothetical protein